MILFILCGFLSLANRIEPNILRTGTGPNRNRIDANRGHPVKCHCSVGHGAQSCWLGSPTGGCKRRRWSFSAFGLVPSTQGSVLGLPTSTCLADASVLDATIATAPPAGFSHSWGHRMAASSGQDFLLLGVADRRGLEAVYALLQREGGTVSVYDLISGFQAVHLFDTLPYRLSVSIVSIRSHVLEAKTFNLYSCSWSQG